MHGGGSFSDGPPLCVEPSAGIVDDPVNNSVGSLRRIEGWSVAAEERHTAERTLRSAITRGDLSPGHRLVEAELAEQIGVNRSSVRQALDGLIAEGLVERIPNRGARVRVVSADEAVAITECRMALEGLLARKAAERITDDEAGRLRAHLDTMTDAVDTGDLLKYSELIGQLYGLVHDAARHPVATGLVERLRAPLVRHQFRLSLRPGRPRVSLQELAELVGAIADRDADRAETAAVAHFQSVIAQLTASNQHTGGFA
jgi:DNA-binding GntR family transcriptional regulator